MPKFLDKLFNWLDKKLGILPQEPESTSNSIPNIPGNYTVISEPVYPEPNTTVTVYKKTNKGLKKLPMKKPRKSRRKTTKPLATFKSRVYKIQYVGGVLDGKIDEVPIPRPENKTNPAYINKMGWDGKTWGDYYYVAEATGRPKKGQVIRYVYSPKFVPKSKPVRPYGEQ